MRCLKKSNWIHAKREVFLECQALGRAEKAPLRGGMNSRPYGQQQLISHRAGHSALPIEFFNSPL
ncbi:MAG: hypothetical protein KAW16_02750, partial [candidate division Zixibacteria bacterium]|nr:hypothetical protein [candidate division Zixibacteria bacterium]